MSAHGPQPGSCGGAVAVTGGVASIMLCVVGGRNDAKRWREAHSIDQTALGLRRSRACAMEGQTARSALPTLNGACTGFIGSVSEPTHLLQRCWTPLVDRDPSRGKLKRTLLRKGGAVG